MNEYSGIFLLVVEDDFLQGDLTRKTIRDEFVGSKVDHLTTESEFCTQIEELAKRPPRVIVMDIKLPWEEMRENRRDPPPEVKREGDRRAGLRCWKQIAERPEFSRTRVLFYSHILDEGLEAEIRDLPSRPQFLNKGHPHATGRSQLAPLLQKIREFLDEP